MNLNFEKIIIGAISVLALQLGCSSVAKIEQTPKPKASPRYEPSRVLYGNQGAPLTIYRYVNLGSVLQAADSDAFKRMIQKYPDSVKIIVKHVPLPQFYPSSLIGSQIFEALRDIDQKRAKDFYELTLSTEQMQRLKSEDDYWNMLKQLKFPIPQVKKEISKGHGTFRILEDYAEYKSLGIEGTPAYVVNGDVLAGTRPYEELELLIETHLRGAK